MIGISSVVKLATPRGELIYEEDFDKAIDCSALPDIAYSLPKTHPFHKLMLLLMSGSPGLTDSDIERFLPLIDEEQGEKDICIITPEHLAPFQSYASGAIETQWDELFPGKGTGFRNWIRYHTRLKELEQKFKHPPKYDGEVWYRNIYAGLLQVVRRAIDEKCYIVRTFY